MIFFVVCDAFKLVEFFLRLKGERGKIKIRSPSHSIWGARFILESGVATMPVFGPREVRRTVFLAVFAVSIIIEGNPYFTSHTKWTQKNQSQL